MEFNQPIQIHEVLKPQQNESVRLELTLTQDQMKKLAHVKDLLSHVLPDATWAELISHLAEKKIAKIEGKVKAISSIENIPVEQEESLKFGNQTELGVSNRNKIREGEARRFCSKQERMPIKVKMRRQIFSKAQKCCEYVDSKTGNQCRSTYQLQIDHVVPVALGGSSERENLRVLCRTHNLLNARQMGLALV